MERVTIPLTSFRHMRVLMVALGSAAVALILVVAAGTFALLAAGIPFMGDGSTLEGVVGAVAVLAIGGLWTWPKVAPWVGWKHEPALVVEADFLTVHHPGLGEPLVIPRQLIQVASVDTTSRGLLAAYRRFRLVGGSPVDRPRSVLGARDIARLTVAAAPNLVVLFTQPMSTTRPGRNIRWGEHMLFRGGKEIRGVALHVGDAGRVRAELARLGVLRAITFHDAAASGIALTMR